jgi:cobalamin biosynthesis protein CobT
MDNCESEDTTEENDDQDENGKKTEHEEFIPSTKPKKLINNSDLVLFMNRYNISIDGLENILKLEKLNKYNEKKKKKFTAKIKKDICNYLTTDPS